MSNRISAAIVLLVAVLLSSTVLCALGILTKSEVLPILGGAVVVAHRLVDTGVRERARVVRKEVESDEPSEPGPGVAPLVGMAVGGVLSMVLFF